MRISIGWRVGILDMAGRIGRDPARLGLLDDLGPHRGVEGEDDPLRRCSAAVPESAPARRSTPRGEAAGRDWRCRARVSAPGQPAGHSARRKMVAKPSGSGGTFGQSARHQGEAAERRSAHELGSGDEDDRAARQIVVHRRARDPAPGRHRRPASHVRHARRSAGRRRRGRAGSARSSSHGRYGRGCAGWRRGRRRSRPASARRYSETVEPAPSGRGPGCRPARHGRRRGPAQAGRALTAVPSAVSSAK